MDLLKALEVFRKNQKWEEYLGCIQNIYEEDKDLIGAKNLLNMFRRDILSSDCEEKSEYVKRSYGVLAHDDFDSFMIALEWNRPSKEKFWLPRRKKLMFVADALMDMEQGNLDELFLSMPPRIGKALANDTPVLTRRGVIPHGNLTVEDEVVGMDGKFKKVIAVHPKCMLDVKVTFSNGEAIVCHENHEWLVYDRARGKEHIMSAKEIEGRTLEYGGEKGKRGHRYVLQLPKCDYVQGEDKELAIDAYTLGVWLGDGTNVNPTICGDKNDHAVIERVIANGSSCWPAARRNGRWMS